jgi:non-homologous end joining protein Ku
MNRVRGSGTITNKHLLPRKLNHSASEASTFEPDKFEDHYEQALTELINAKRQGKIINPKPRPVTKTSSI